MTTKTLLVALASLAAGPALAHEVSDNLIEVHATDTGALSGQWEIPVSDLEDLWGATSGTPAARLAAAKAHQKAIVGAVHDDLSFAAGEDVACPVAWGPQTETLHKDRAYAVLPFAGQCPPGDLRGIEVKWTFLAEATDERQALVSFSSAGGTQAAILSRDEPRLKFGLIGEDTFAHFRMYFHDGVMHIWTGVDHILFLLTLILPAVFFLDRRQWLARPRFRDTAGEIVKTVSSFTVAHSVTLCLVTFHWLTIPSRLVEAVIAFSVLLAGLNNIFPVIDKGRWKLAFVFGLVHGIGFAEVLIDLQLPTAALINSLVGFNLGVETGQLAIVGTVLPLAFAARRTMFYRRVVFLGGSAAAAGVAALWLVDRVFALEFMPF